MWRNCKELEMQYLKFQVNMRRYGRVHENLQMYVDEQVWRTEYTSLEEKREALCQAFHVDHWREENENPEKQLGIGGGYGQFGILEEDEFLRLLKTTGKRVQKFHETPDEYREQFYKIKYATNDNGARMLLPQGETGRVSVDAGEEGEGEVIERVVSGIESREVQKDMDVYEIAMKRFQIDKELEVQKMKKELEELEKAEPINLFDDM
ncbi:hypothetical protein FGO68_gene7114 [Halteria grandinella]|uniref:Uncharacterized protein n=1 Tax=Halteria grandinella TaxID=5974 RepID=A0A8J8NQ52_HALGN|nr:hypothetical protein FGO68_gene7114 [Halteria grandinella]